MYYRYLMPFLCVSVCACCVCVRVFFFLMCWYVCVCVCVCVCVWRAFITAGVADLEAKVKEQGLKRALIEP